jgi:hypothetical protein
MDDGEARYTTSQVYIMIISSFVSLTMSMQYIYNVNRWTLDQYLPRAYVPSPTTSCIGTLSCKPARLDYGKYDLAEPKAFVTYIITNATVSIPPSPTRPNCTERKVPYWRTWYPA